MASMASKEAIVEVAFGLESHESKTKTIPSSVQVEEPWLWSSTSASRTCAEKYRFEMEIWCLDVSFCVWCATARSLSKCSPNAVLNWEAHSLSSGKGPMRGRKCTTWRGFGGLKLAAGMLDELVEGQRNSFDLVTLLLVLLSLFLFLRSCRLRCSVNLVIQVKRA